MAGRSDGDKMIGRPPTVEAPSGTGPECRSHAVATRIVHWSASLEVHRMQGFPEARGPQAFNQGRLATILLIEPRRQTRRYRSSTAKWDLSQAQLADNAQEMDVVSTPEASP